MPDDEEGKRLLRLAKMADTDDENPDEAKIPWAANINPFKKDEDDVGMTPEEFLRLTKEKKDLPELAMIDVSGGKYLDGSLKVKVPDEGPKGYKIVPMNKYTDPLNLHPSHRGGKHKVYPVWEQMADSSTSPGDPKSVVAVGYGADLRVGASQLFHKSLTDITPEALKKAEDVFSVKWGEQMKARKIHPIDPKLQKEFERVSELEQVESEAMYKRMGEAKNKEEKGTIWKNWIYRPVHPVTREWQKATEPTYLPIPKSAPQREVPPMKNRSKDLDRLLWRMKK